MNSILLFTQGTSQMPTITINGLVTDDSGASQTFSASAIIDVVTITSAIVSPQTAAAGTARTLTVIAASSASGVLTFGTPTATGIVFTPVTGQPAGQAKWTFVY
jgi:hypothetical protein